MSDLAEACIRLKNALGYSTPDARSIALDNIAGIARSGQMLLNLLDSWTKGDEQVRQVIPQLIGLTTLTPEAVQTAGQMMNKSGKLALVVLAQFQVENLIRNIARELGVASTRMGFYRCAKAVLSALSMPADRLYVLNVAARVRNSLHSNGIHHQQHANEPPRIDIAGVSYEFRDGNPVSCATWEHIAHALEASVGVIQEILFTQQIRQIPDPMMDEYAWEQETGP